MALVAGILSIVKDGLFTLMKGATIICEAAPWAVEVVQRKYPENTALLESIKTVQAACQIMRLNITQQKDVDRQASRPPGVVSPGSPAAPPPEPEPEV